MAAISRVKQGDEGTVLKPWWVRLSDGAAALGTATNPIRTLATDLAGAATEATVAAILARFPTLGQKVAVGSIPVVQASDASVLTNDLIEEEARSSDSTHTLVGFSAANSSSNVKQTLWPFHAQSGPFVCDGDTYLGSNDPVLPTAAMTLYLRSTSAQDGPGGSGCKRIQVHYLDAAYAEKKVMVTMNGTTRVQIATDIFRVNRLYAAKALDGSGAGPAGNILVVPAAALDIYHGMIVDRNISFCGFWTVPAGKRLGISLCLASVGGVQAAKAVRLTLGVKRSMDGDLTDFYYARAIMVLPSGPSSAVFSPKVWVPEKTDLRLAIDANVSGEAGVTLEGVTEDL